MNYVLVATLAAGAAGTIAYFYTKSQKTDVVTDTKNDTTLPNPPPATLTPKAPPPGAVDDKRLQSIVSYWRKTHPNATQAEIDEEYQVELWNNTNTTVAADPYAGPQGQVGWAQWLGSHTNASAAELSAAFKHYYPS